MKNLISYDTYILNYQVDGQKLPHIFAQTGDIEAC